MSFWDRFKQHFASDNPGLRGLFGLPDPRQQRREFYQIIQRLEDTVKLTGKNDLIEKRLLLDKLRSLCTNPDYNNILDKFEREIEKKEQQHEQIALMNTISQGRLVFRVLSDDVRRKILFNPPNIFSPLIGNEEAKEIVAWSLYGALGCEDHVLSENFLLTGPASSGKTMFARLIADILGLPFVEIAASTLAKQKQPLEYMLDKIIEVCKNFKPSQMSKLLYSTEIVDAENLTLRPRLNKPTTCEKGTDYCFNKFTLPPIVIFIDEAHALPSALEQALLKITERGDAFMTTETDSTADCSKVCWILATTERGKLFKPFDTRFEKINLRLYAKKEIAEIIHNIDEFEDWDMDTCRLVAHYCNRIPREAISFAKKVKQAMIATPGKIEDVAAKVAERKGIDPFGMTYQRLEILRVLGQHPASIGALCAAVGCEEEELHRFILPWLIASTPDQESYVIVTNRHYITPAGLAELDKRDIDYRSAKDVLTKVDFEVYLDSKYKALCKLYAAFVKDARVEDAMPKVDEFLSDPKNIKRLRRVGKVLATNYTEPEKVKTILEWIEAYLDWRGEQ